MEDLLNLLKLTFHYSPLDVPRHDEAFAGARTWLQMVLAVSHRLQLSFLNENPFTTSSKVKSSPSEDLYHHPL